MGNILSTVDNNIVEANEINTMENEAKEVGKVIKEIAERVTIDVIEEVAIQEIDKKLLTTPKTTKLEKIIEDKPYNPDPTHYSNLKRENLNVPSIKVNPITTYPSSQLTSYKKLQKQSFFSFYI